MPRGQRSRGGVTTMSNYSWSSGGCRGVGRTWGQYAWHPGDTWMSFGAPVFNFEGREMCAAARPWDWGLRLLRDEELAPPIRQLTRPQRCWGWGESRLGHQGEWWPLLVASRPATVIGAVVPPSRFPFVNFPQEERSKWWEAWDPAHTSLRPVPQNWSHPQGAWESWQLRVCNWLLIPRDWLPLAEDSHLARGHTPFPRDSSGPVTVNQWQIFKAQLPCCNLDHLQGHLCSRVPREISWDHCYNHIIAQFLPLPGLSFFSPHPSNPENTLK